MFQGLDMGEALGVAFGACLVMLSLWLLYHWAIKPERESRRRNAWRTIEEMHRNHWEHFRRRPLPFEKRYEASTTHAETNTEGELQAAELNLR